MPPPKDFSFNKWWRFKCRVKILIVIDDFDDGGFGDGNFHLGHVLRVLDTDPPPHVEFVVTKAHRQTTDGADVLTNFRFDAHDLSGYSQIWLFGINPGTDPLSGAELKALAQFMDGGGGVFATGDHEDLGRAMCGDVPRVRSMRRWYYPNPGPNGEPVAPAVSGAERHDTVMNLGMGGSQADEVPQPIFPKYTSRKLGGGLIYRVRKYPHPVLCGPDGVIEYLPDHMHEGLCEKPADLTKTWTFAGYACTEYPAVGGHQESPKVIAEAVTRNTDGDEFGVIAAYDGHRVNVGRVVVDATWHHWFNINLNGFVAVAADPMHPAHAAMMPKWRAIQAYYRNVALWLARPSLRKCLRNGGWLAVIKYPDIRIGFRPLDTVRDRVQYFWQLGVFARDAMGRLASQCQFTEWAIEPIPEIELTPWPPFPGPLPPDPPPWLDVTDLEHMTLGGAVHELIVQFGREKDPQAILDKRGDEVFAAVRKGATLGVGEMLKRYAAAGPDAAQMLKTLQMP